MAGAFALFAAASAAATIDLVWDPLRATGPDNRAALQRGSDKEQMQAISRLKIDTAKTISALEDAARGTGPVAEHAARALEAIRRRVR